MAVLVDNLAIILCLLVGIGMIVLESLMPGFGLPGIAGSALLAVGTALLWAKYGASAGLCALLVSLLLAGTAAILSFRSAYKGRLSRSKIILNTEEQSVAQDDTAVEGLTGVTLTVLNPVGMADINGERRQVMSECAYLGKGVKVRVTGRRGADLIVKAEE